MYKYIVILLLVSSVVHAQKIDKGVFVEGVDAGLSISQGKQAGITYVHKFGNAADFDTTDGEVVVWDGANDGGINAMDYTYSATNDIDSVISSSTNDVGSVSIQGLDATYTLTNQTVTLNGQTRVALTTPLRRVFRMKNEGTSNFVGNISCYITNSPTTAGVVNTPANVRAVVDDGNNQTLMAIYTVPVGKKAYLRSFYASLSGANKSSNYRIRLKARPFGKVFQLKHITALSSTGSSRIQHTYLEPELYEAKTDLVITAETTAVGITGSEVSAGFDIVLVDD